MLIGTFVVGLLSWFFYTKNETSVKNLQTSVVESAQASKKIQNYYSDSISNYYRKVKEKIIRFPDEEKIANTQETMLEILRSKHNLPSGAFKINPDTIEGRNKDDTHIRHELHVECFNISRGVYESILDHVVREFDTYAEIEEMSIELLTKNLSKNALEGEVFEFSSAAPVNYDFEFVLVWYQDKNQTKT